MLDFRIYSWKNSHEAKKMSMDKFLNKLLDILKEDLELRSAIIDLVAARAEAERALASWRDRR